ncbi:MAG: drug/metabolite transporter (DMT)-like permease [Bacteroidia bacterium]|jgi:drug/metabolite transporter (DMT)-like permease
MIALALSIAASSVLLVIFKYFGRFKVDTFQAISVNYVVAASLGFLLAPAAYSPAELLAKPWAISAIIIGCLFLSMFYVMAISSQKVGVAISSVANKMSFIIPVVAAVLLYNETLSGLRIVGVLGALFAVGMVTFPKQGVDIERKYLALPLIIFFGSGLLDTIFNYVKNNQLGANEVEVFCASLFFVSAVLGCTIVLGMRLFKGKTLATKSIVAGVALGIPNYFSIHFLLLGLKEMPGSEFFPINNTGIVLLSTLLAIVLFSEKLSKLNWAGIVLALFSIILIAAA